VLLIHHVEALVPTAVLPSVNTKPMHHSVFKATYKTTAICPLKLAFSCHLVVLPSSAISGAISPVINPLALLDPLVETAQVITSVRPDFDTISLLC
jgi:hypothetical protein